MLNSEFHVSQRIRTKIIYFMFDAISIIFSLISGISLWYYGTIIGSKSTYIPAEAYYWLKAVCIVAIMATILVYICFGLYNNLWEYANIEEVLKIIIANTIIFVIIYAYSQLVVAKEIGIEIPKRLLFVSCLLNILLFVLSRFGHGIIKKLSAFASRAVNNKTGYKRVMIIGAGFEGYGVIKSILSGEIENRIPVLVMDKDENKNNTYILGVRVLSCLDKMEEMVDEYEVEEIIIAIPYSNKKDQADILKLCMQTKCNLKILPSMREVSYADRGLAVDLRDINISDLLFREEIDLDNIKIEHFIKNKVVLVTGGGGTIGSELCRQIAKYGPEKIIIFDIYENNAFLLKVEIDELYFDDFETIIRIGSIRDIDRLREVFDEFSPDIIFHAAAHKHVGLMEENYQEAVRNNIFGTLNVIKLADEYGVSKFVMLSTDKAVNPAGIMGETKRVAEILVKAYSQQSETKYVTVRFGNVLGSNGSVIPLFQNQITKGGPITVTDENVERFFMTIPEASQLVLQAATSDVDGEVLVLDMGEPIKIMDIAKNLAKINGYTVGEDIEIKIIGLRQGEKITEELMFEFETIDTDKMVHEKIFVTKDSRELEIDLLLLEEYIENLNLCENKDDVSLILDRIINGF